MIPRIIPINATQKNVRPPVRLIIIQSEDLLSSPTAMFASGQTLIPALVKLCKVCQPSWNKNSSSFAPNKNPKSEIAATIHKIAKNKEKFGTPKETKALYKLAFEIDESVISGLPYVTYLYLNGESNLAFEKAELLSQKDAPDKLQVENLKLLVKSAIDNNDVEQADLYFNKLLKKKTIPDFLFAAVYYRFKGDYQKANTYIRKSNPQLLRSNKLKEIYSQNTISAYILVN